MKNSNLIDGATSIIVENERKYLTPEALYTMLPCGVFNIQFVINKIMDYSPHQRFPKPKYDLCIVLDSWYRLAVINRVMIINETTAEKM